MPTPIAPKLSQGSAPYTGDAVARAGYDVVVLCAEEYQPPRDDFRGLVDVIHAPNDDNGERLSPREASLAKMAAHRVVDHVRNGRHVLVTCMMGRNRSGLVTALALRELTGMSGSECVNVIRRKRPNALTSPVFVRYLRALPRVAGR